MPSELLGAVAEHGYVVVPRVGHARHYQELTRALGATEVGREVIALRPGAHAYVAKPGPVPLHTDHPDVDVIGWLCEKQDEADGANWLLDMRPVIQALDGDTRAELRRAHLLCPPVTGGPPSERRPVLRRCGGHDRVFLPPWLIEAEPIAWRKDVVKSFQQRVSTAIRASKIAVRLGEGDALFVDNGRVLHGRGAISSTSQRRLLRVWLTLPVFNRSLMEKEQPHV